jgi:hypothetical protein
MSEGCLAGRLWLSAFTIVLVLFRGTPSRGETFDELKGMSIDVSFEFLTIWQPNNPSISADLPKYDRELTKRVLRAYISSQGRIFDFTTVAPTQDPSGRYRITTLDKAAEQRDGGMFTWTMLDGHLSRILQLPEGFRVFTVAVDKAKLTCQFSMRDERDSKTGRIVPYGSSRAVYERTLTSQKCSVKLGNIFSSDQ